MCLVFVAGVTSLPLQFQSISIPDGFGTPYAGIASGSLGKSFIAVGIGYVVSFAENETGYFSQEGPPLTTLPAADDYDVCVSDDVLSAAVVPINNGTVYILGRASRADEWNVIQPLQDHLPGSLRWGEAMACSVNMDVIVVTAYEISTGNYALPVYVRSGTTWNFSHTINGTFGGEVSSPLITVTNEAERIVFALTTTNVNVHRLNGSFIQSIPGAPSGICSLSVDGYGWRLGIGTCAFDSFIGRQIVYQWSVIDEQYGEETFLQYDGYNGTSSGQGSSGAFCKGGQVFLSGMPFQDPETSTAMIIWESQFGVNNWTVSSLLYSFGGGSRVGAYQYSYHQISVNGDTVISITETAILIFRGVANCSSVPPIPGDIPPYFPPNDSPSEPPIDSPLVPPASIPETPLVSPPSPLQPSPIDPPISPPIIAPSSLPIDSPIESPVDVPLVPHSSPSNGSMPESTSPVIIQNGNITIFAYIGFFALVFLLMLICVLNGL